MDLYRKKKELFLVLCLGASFEVNYEGSRLIWSRRRGPVDDTFSRWTHAAVTWRDGKPGRTAGAGGPGLDAPMLTYQSLIRFILIRQA